METLHQWTRTASVWRFALETRTKAHLAQFPWYMPTCTEPQKRRILAREFADELVDKGATYVKLGQFLSTRSDLLSAEVIQELTRLQDDLGAMEPAQLDRVFVEDMGDTPDNVFREFDPTPFAAASLGQVHRATLRTGEAVAVKVQRPDLRDTIEGDMQTLLSIAGALDRVEPAQDVTSLFTEMREILYEEIDFGHELSNLKRFRTQFRNVEFVRCPAPYEAYCTERILTSEYVDAIKITNVKGPQPVIAERLMKLFLSQTLIKGFFHADPHPGNLSVDRDGVIVYYDLGMAGEIDVRTKQKLGNLALAFYANDNETLYEEMKGLNMLAPNADFTSVITAASWFRKFMDQGDIGMDSNLLAVAADKPLRLPSKFAYVLRAFTLTESTCKSLDPDFTPLPLLQPFINQFMSEVDLESKFREYGQSLMMTPQRIQRLESFINSLETGRMNLRVRSPSSETQIRKMGKVQEALLFLCAFELVGTLPSTWPVAAVVQVYCGLMVVMLLVQSRLTL
jgi:predicted unusual protein kinase regulating ubiquinone biosynthesis (AarF/ABC1/UbiB family)